MSDEKTEEKVAPAALDYRVWLVSDGWETPVSILALINATESGEVRWIRDFGERYVASWRMERREDRDGRQITVIMRCGTNQPSDRADVTFGEFGIVDGPYQLQGPGIDHLRSLVMHKVHNEAVLDLKRALIKSPKGDEPDEDGKPREKFGPWFLYRHEVTGEPLWTTDDVVPPHHVLVATRGKDGVLRWTL